jgi:hypothetical protein
MWLVLQNTLVVKSVEVVNVVEIRDKVIEINLQGRQQNESFVC